MAVAVATDRRGRAARALGVAALVAAAAPLLVRGRGNLWTALGARPDPLERAAALDGPADEAPVTRPAPPAPAPAGDVMLRGERPGDAPAIGAVLTAAFAGPSGDAPEAALVAALRAEPAFDRDRSLVAEAAGEVVGHLLLSAVTAGGEPALALAPMAVAPAYQRRGIGGALLREALRRADAAGLAVIVLGQPRYYPRFGFSPARPYGLHPPFEAPDEAWLVRPAPGVPPPRGPVRYPPPFLWAPYLNGT